MTVSAFSGYLLLILCISLKQTQNIIFLSKGLPKMGNDRIWQEMKSNIISKVSFCRFRCSSRVSRLSKIEVENFGQLSLFRAAFCDNTTFSFASQFFDACSCLGSCFCGCCWNCFFFFLLYLFIYLAIFYIFLLRKNTLNEIQVVRIKESVKYLKKGGKGKARTTYARCLPRGNKRIWSICKKNLIEVKI